jgi:hypothetical protein
LETERRQSIAHNSDSSKEARMQERRLCPRRRVLKSGSVVRSGNRAAIECTVRNISDTGACLQISVVHDLSTDFTLEVGDARHSGRVVWRSKDRSGIAYTREPKAETELFAGRR